MKKYALVCMLLCAVAFSVKSQNGSISPQQSSRAGEENTYVYKAPKGLAIPEGAMAQILYLNKSYGILTAPLKKDGDAYTFSFKVPDSTQAVAIGIMDAEKNLIDNNNKEGYITYPQDANGKKFPGAGINAAILLNKGGIAAYYHKVEIPGSDILAMYEKDFAADPSLKEKNYYSYLTTLYSLKKEEAKPQLVDYAKEMLSTSDESKWITASNLYRVLKMQEEQAATEKKILETFPNGTFASQKFITSFRSLKDPAEMLAKMEEYHTRFKASPAIDDNFYTSILTAYADQSDWDNFYKYAGKVSDFNSLFNTFNSVAWKLSGESLSVPGKELEMARKIAGQSIQMIYAMIDQPEKYRSKLGIPPDEDMAKALNSTLQANADTYALILYKLGMGDSAYYYQQIAIGDLKNASGDELERYALYAEKAKGADFARSFLEKQLEEGKGSEAMRTQLAALYKKQNLPESKLTEMFAKADAKIKEDLAKEVEKKMNVYKGADFTLKNLEGNNVSLASLKGKVVVLDFWATWCGPCKASFPAMQTAMNKYKNDKDVAFVFIDTWEHKEPKPMRDDAAKFIADNKYTFPVALDEKDKVVTDYNVSGIPTKFVVDKKGNVKYTSIGYAGKPDELVEELSMMIENAKKG